MAKPDTKNAHVRGGSQRREDPEVAASDADRLLNDPAFVRGFEAFREELIRCIIDMKHDGSPEADAYERHKCLQLRDLSDLKRHISVSVQKQNLRLANFKPTEKDKPDGRQSRNT